MLLKYLRDSVKLITATATAATLHSYYKSINDDKIRIKYEGLLKENTRVLETLNDLKIDELKQELLRTKIEALKGRLSEESNNISKEIESLNKIDPNNLGGITDFKTHLNNFINESQKSNKTVNDIIELISGNSNNNIIDKDNLIKLIKELIEN